LDGLRRIEQRRFARSRPAAAQIDRRDRRLVENDDGCAGAEPGVRAMTDLEAGDIGNEVAQRHEDHSSLSPLPERRRMPCNRHGGRCISCAMPNVTIIAALVAGMLSFLSPCVLPLVPPYLVYLTGTSLERLADEEPEPRVRRETVAAALLFVLGFS